MKRKLIPITNNSRQFYVIFPISFGFVRIICTQNTDKIKISKEIFSNLFKIENLYSNGEHLL